MSHEIYERVGLVMQNYDWYLDDKIILNYSWFAHPSAELDQRIGIANILNETKKERAKLAALGFVMFDGISYSTNRISVNYRSILNEIIIGAVSITYNAGHILTVSDYSLNDTEFLPDGILSWDGFLKTCKRYMGLLEANRAAASAIKFLLPQPIAEEILTEFAV